MFGLFIGLYLCDLVAYLGFGGCYFIVVLLGTCDLLLFAVVCGVVCLLLTLSSWLLFRKAYAAVYDFGSLLLDWIGWFDVCFVGCLQALFWCTHGLRLFWVL